mgnify:CR=1 FL=1
MSTLPWASRYTGVFSSLGVKLRVVPEAMVMVVQWNTPLLGTGSTVLFVMVSAPYEPSLPALKAAAGRRGAASSVSAASIPGNSRVFMVREGAGFWGIRMKNRFTQSAGSPAAARGARR